MSVEKKWYVLKVISGQEVKIKSYIEMEMLRSKWENVVTSILIPTEKIYKIVGGKKVIKEKTLFPGYIYIEADVKRFSSEVIATIRAINNVIHFIGGNRPQSLRTVEVQKLLGKLDEMVGQGETLLEPYIINETVKIIDGPFNDFIGTIEEVNDDKKKLKVVVKIFGRRTPVEVNYVQVEKVN
jgi:transcription termination/antitermination protein NusG